MSEADHNGNDYSAQEKKPPDKKKSFVIRDTPVWLDTHQDWISDGARQLYKVLRALADQKTGRLFIPGGGWIKLKTIEQKAGMCDETRKKYSRQLLALGGIRIHRDYVIRSIHGRNRKVLGQSQITVLPLHPPNTHKHRASTTAKTSDNADSSDEHRVSTTANSTTANAENGLLQPKSSTVEEVSAQYLSKNTKGGADVSVSGVPDSVADNQSIPSSSKSTPPSDDADPVLEEWARKQILKCAKRTVLDPAAYLFVARQNFFDNLPVKVESYLITELSSYIQCCIWDCPDLGIGFHELKLYLERLCDAYNLPIDPADRGITDRIFAAVIHKHRDSLRVVEPFGLYPSSQYQSFRSGAGPPAKGWQPYRTAVL